MPCAIVLNPLSSTPAYRAEWLPTLELHPQHAALKATWELLFILVSIARQESPA